MVLRNVAPISWGSRVVGELPPRTCVKLVSAANANAKWSLDGHCISTQRSRLASWLHATSSSGTT